MTKLYFMSSHYFDCETKSEVKELEKLITLKEEQVGSGDFCACCGATAFFGYPKATVQTKYKELDRVHAGIAVIPGIHGEEKRSGKRRVYHIETSNGPITVDLVTSFNQEELDAREDDAYGW